MADERLKRRIEAAHSWLEEARKRYWEASHDVKDLERIRHDDGSLEDLEHFHNRRAREKERRDRREEIKDHLVKKIAGFEHLLEHRKEHRQEVREKRREAGNFEQHSQAIVTFDGVDVVEDAAHWLQRARAAGWTGTLVSGFRTPEHSRELCMQMCGAPTCPGRCAGVTSNHTHTGAPGPAVDVSEFGLFESVSARIGSPYKNALPVDPVHFSLSGH
jgi:hypothetical protein